MRKFTKLIDNYGRIHDYLRISLTGKCNLNCSYCMPNKSFQNNNQIILSNIITSNEILFLANYFCYRGIRKIRLTGGEPLLRSDLQQIIKDLNDLKCQHKHFNEIAMTTNGVKFKKYAENLLLAGLNSVNISLDSLKSERILKLTGQSTFKHSMAAIIKAIEVGFKRIKHNIIVNKVMRKLFSYKQMLNIIQNSYPNLICLNEKSFDVTKLFQVSGWLGKIGFITSMTENFCAGCSRLRITADGNLKICLHDNYEVSLVEILRNKMNSHVIDDWFADKPNYNLKQSKQLNKIYDQLDEIVDQALTKKSASHKDTNSDKIIHDNNENNIDDNNHTDELYELLTPKGDVFTVARLAGIQAAKQTSNIIPLCHQVPLSHISVDIGYRLGKIHIQSQVKAVGQSTGVEMEALTAVSVAALTVYDMLKPLQKGPIIIEKIELLEKLGGSKGSYLKLGASK
uniref:Molybdenum cofactor biosynthesis protein 1 n=1 Tax=Schistosoma haematobium TaxID=6185 RepID=A0A095A2R4_SCHHA